MGFFSKLFSSDIESDNIPSFDLSKEENFVSLMEYEEEMNAKTDFEKLDDMLDWLKTRFTVDSKILKYVKVGDYLIDAIIFTKKGFFIINLQSMESGCFYGNLSDTYLKVYPKNAVGIDSYIGCAKIHKKNLKKFEYTEVLNPLGQLVVWKEAIKRQKRLRKYKFYTVVVTQNDVLLSRNLHCSPFFFSLFDFGNFVNITKTAYDKEQVDEAYNAFATFEN